MFANEEIYKLQDEVERLRNAIKEHHAQKADDRCIEDDDKLYAAAGLPPCDRRVGSKFEMAVNCMRFIANRCEGGGWPSYVELEVKNDELYAALDAVINGMPYGAIWRNGVAQDWHVRAKEVLRKYRSLKCELKPTTTSPSEAS